ncbi:hypothetical protein [Glutamicibacter sp. PS]|uniref:hypothetical protein n=1 Tax=Glutamicibacter sp. PS TaxID=3075634 RepID=UPI002849CAC5|nr:hypothetical protein [Glutamicibacter sp. PS]MDR4532864.1 hypothetical protein [Glutamicibacter sp. PS]
MSTSLHWRYLAEDDPFGLGVPKGEASTSLELGAAWCDEAAVACLIEVDDAD